MCMHSIVLLARDVSFRTAATRSYEVRSAGPITWSRAAERTKPVSGSGVAGQRCRAATTARPSHRATRNAARPTPTGSASGPGRPGRAGPSLQEVADLRPRRVDHDRQRRADLRLGTGAVVEPAVGVER